MGTTGKFYGRGFRNISGLKHLDRIAGAAAAQAPLGRFLYPYAWRDVVFFKDDFTDDTLSTFAWTANQNTPSGGGATFAIPAAGSSGGIATCITGTDATAANRMFNLYGHLAYKGDNNCGMEVRFKVSSAAAIEFSMGFIDTQTSITAPSALVTDIDTPAFAAGMGDAALVHLDTAETLATMALACLGSGSLNTGSKDAIGTLLPTAATYMTVRVQIATNDVVATIDDGTTNFTTVTKLSGIEGGTLVRPIIFLNGTSTTSKTLDVDYVVAWQDR